MIVQLPFQDYAPDADPLTPGVLLDMDGFFSTQRGLKALPSPIIITVPPPDLEDPVVRGAIAAILTNGTQVVLEGTRNAVWLLVQQEGLDTGTWRSLTALIPPGPAVTDFHPTGEPWRFATYGNDIVAVNSSLMVLISDSGADMTALPSPPPLPAFVASTYSGFFYGLFNSNQLYGSIFGPRADFADNELSIAAGTFALALTQTPGPITGILPLRQGVIVYKANSTYAGSFTGGRFFWSFNTISENIGCPVQEAAIEVGGFQYFLGNNDFYYTDGATVNPIPNRLREFFFSRLNVAFVTAVRARYDPNIEVIFWHYSSNGTSEKGLVMGTLDEWVAFNLRTQRWSKGEMVIENVLNPYYLKPPTLTYQQVEMQWPRYNLIPALQYNTITASGSNVTVPAVVLADHSTYGLNGPSKGGFIKLRFGDSTKYTQINQVRPRFAQWPINNRALLLTKRHHVLGRPIPDQPIPLFTSGSEPVQIGFEPAPATEGLHAPLTPDGAFNVIQSSRIHQLQLEVECDVEIIGFEVDAIPAGVN